MTSIILVSTWTTTLTFWDSLFIINEFWSAECGNYVAGWMWSQYNIGSAWWDSRLMLVCYATQDHDVVSFFCQYYWQQSIDYWKKVMVLEKEVNDISHFCVKIYHSRYLYLSVLIWVCWNNGENIVHLLFFFHNVQQFNYFFFLHRWVLCVLVGERGLTGGKYSELSVIASYRKCYLFPPTCHFFCSNFSPNTHKKDH